MVNRLSAEIRFDVGLERVQTRPPLVASAPWLSTSGVQAPRLRGGNPPPPRDGGVGLECWMRRGRRRSGPAHARNEVVSDEAPSGPSRRGPVNSTRPVAREAHRFLSGLRPSSPADKLRDAVAASPARETPASDPKLVAGGTQSRKQVGRARRGVSLNVVVEDQQASSDIVSSPKRRMIGESPRTGISTPGRRRGPR